MHSIHGDGLRISGRQGVVTVDVSRKLTPPGARGIAVPRRFHVAGLEALSKIGGRLRAPLRILLEAFKHNAIELGRE